MFRKRRYIGDRDPIESVGFGTLLMGLMGTMGGGLFGWLLAIPGLAAALGGIIAGLPGAAVGFAAGLVANFWPLRRSEKQSDGTLENASFYDPIKPSFIKNNISLSNKCEEFGAVFGFLSATFASVMVVDTVNKAKKVTNQVINGCYPIPPRND